MEKTFKALPKDYRTESEKQGVIDNPPDRLVLGDFSYKI